MITDKDVVLAYVAARNRTRIVTPYRILRIRTGKPREDVNTAIMKAFNKGYIKTTVPDILKGFVTRKGKELVK